MKLRWVEKIGVLSFLFPQKYKIEFVQDIIENCRGNKIYIIKDPHHDPWLIQFQCPCGCGSIIHLNLLKEANPCWHYYIDKINRITIRPSVNRLIGCQSHFNVVKSKIIWVERCKSPLSFK